MLLKQARISVFSGFICSVIMVADTNCPAGLGTQAGLEHRQRRLGKLEDGLRFAQWPIKPDWRNHSHGDTFKDVIRVNMQGMEMIQQMERSLAYRMVSLTGTTYN